MILLVFELAEAVSPYLTAILVLLGVLVGFVAGSTIQLAIEHREIYDDYEPKHLAPKRTVLGLSIRHTT